MLSLDSPLWARMQHAYGDAADIPALLRQLGSLPDATGESEPWFTLWSALAHQGDVYSASFAAVPHVVAALATQPLAATATYFQFPAWVEICRQRQELDVEPELAPAYFGALARLPALAAAASARTWDHEMLACVLAAIAAAKGGADMAEAALELTPERAEAYREWLEDQ